MRKKPTQRPPQCNEVELLAARVRIEGYLTTHKQRLKNMLAHDSGVTFTGVLAGPIKKVKAMSSYEFINANGGTQVIFEGLHLPSGVRSRFKAVEHVNIGKGWLLRDVDKNIRFAIPCIHLDELTVSATQETN